MKPVGIVRQIDSLGRILIPKGLRKSMDLKDGDSLELFVEDNTIVLRKYQPACILCGTAKNIVTFKGHNFCPDCVRELTSKLL